LRHADGGNEDICRAAQTGQIPCARVGHGHRAILIGQELRDRFANQDRAPDDNSMKAGQIAQMILGQHDGANRRASDQSILTEHQFAGIDGVKTIDVL